MRKSLWPSWSATSGSDNPCCIHRDAAVCRNSCIVHGSISAAVQAASIKPFASSLLHRLVPDFARMGSFGHLSVHSMAKNRTASAPRYTVRGFPVFDSATNSVPASSLKSLTLRRQSSPYRQPLRRCRLHQRPEFGWLAVINQIPRFFIGEETRTRPPDCFEGFHHSRPNLDTVGPRYGRTEICRTGIPCQQLRCLRLGLPVSVVAARAVPERPSRPLRAATDWSPDCAGEGREAILSLGYGFDQSGADYCGVMRP